MKKILVIEDDEELKKGFAEALGADGYEVFQAGSGPEGIKICQSKQPDVILSDINLPGMSGFQLLKELKSLGITTRVILITGYIKEYEAQEALDLGCFGFLAKPVSMKDLRMTVQHALAGEEQVITDKEFARIPLDAFISGKQVLVSVYVKLGDGRFLKIAHSGQEIDMQRVRSFKEKGVSELWVEKEDLAKYIDVTKKLSRAALVNDKLSPNAKLKMIRHALETNAENLRVMGIAADTIAHAQAVIEDMLVFMGGSPEGEAILDVFVNSMPSLYGRAVTSASIAAILATALGWTIKKNIMALTLGAFLMDVGMYKLPENLRTKDPKRMQKEEFAEYIKHPQYSVEMIKDIKDMPPEVIHIARQHHADGTENGFPSDIRRNDIYPMSKIVQFIDQFVYIMQKHTKPEQRTNREAMVKLIESMHPRPLDETAASALMIVFKEKTFAKAKEECVKMLRKVVRVQ